jgi:hypothetical protein
MDHRLDRRLNGARPHAVGRHSVRHAASGDGVLLARIGGSLQLDRHAATPTRGAISPRSRRLRKSAERQIWRVYHRHNGFRVSGSRSSTWLADHAGERVTVEVRLAHDLESSPRVEVDVRPPDSTAPRPRRRGGCARLHDGRPQPLPLAFGARADCDEVPVRAVVIALSCWTHSGIARPQTSGRRLEGASASCRSMTLVPRRRCSMRRICIR